MPNATAFVVGNGFVLVVIGVFVLTIFGGEASPAAGPSPVGSTIDATIGAFFLVFALRSYLRMPDPNALPPKWMASLDSISPSKAFLFGTILMATNFSTLPLYVTGLKEIVLTEVGTLESVVAFVTLILIVLSELLAPVSIYALAPTRVAVPLKSVRDLLEKNHRTIGIFVFAAFGIYLMSKGLMGLLR